MIEPAIITVLAVAIGYCMGYQWADNKHRKFIISELEAERVVLKDALKLVSETHNNLVQTQANTDARLMDIEQKISFMIQGVKK